jgi:hypothetical protein
MGVPTSEIHKEHVVALGGGKKLKLMTTGVTIIIRSISDEGTGVRGITYIHSKGMKLNASSLTLLSGC